MKRLLLGTLLVALTGLTSTLLTGLAPDTAHSAAPDEDAKTIAKEIKNLSNQWAQVFTNKELSFLKRIWADDFAYIMPDGSVYNKNSFLALCRTMTDTNTSTSVDITTFNVRVYGPNFAVATGTDQFTGTDKDGKPFSNKGRFTNVWVRKKGTWQVVAGHASKLE